MIDGLKMEIQIHLLYEANTDRSETHKKAISLAPADSSLPTGDIPTPNQHLILLHSGDKADRVGLRRDGSTGTLVGLVGGDPVVGGVAARLATVGGAGGDRHDFGVAGAVLDGADIVTAPAAVAGVAEIGFAVGAVGHPVFAPAAVLGPRHLAVLVERNDLGRTGGNGEPEVRGAALARVGLTVLAGLVPDDDGHGAGTGVGESGRVGVAVDRVDHDHVAAVWRADVADVFIDIPVGNRRGLRAEPGGRASGRLVQNGSGV